MSRRIDYLTADIMSRALMTRERYGQDEAFHAAVDQGVDATLAATILMRTVARVEFSAMAERSDRRHTQRPQS